MRFRFFLKAMVWVIFPAMVSGQALPIAVDGSFDDWTGVSLFSDPLNPGAEIDFIEMEVSNDENYLFIRLKTAEKFHLTDDNEVFLYLDTDYDASTGTPFNGMGAELVINLGSREVAFYPGSVPVYVSLYDIGFHSLPTVSGDEFEIAISRDVLPDSEHPLFPESNVRIAFKDYASGDAMPNVNLHFIYYFNNGPVPDYEPVTLEKANENHLRLLTYNTLYDGLDDLDRTEHFKRIVAAIQPDIVTFNECWDMTPGMVATFMNTAVPLPNFQNWHAVKLDAGNVTASRYPILQSWEVKSGSRMTASLIDLPSSYATDVMVVNAHLRCCDEDDLRQAEADAFVKFILDAQSPGGMIDLAENTPFVLSGDLNLVGDDHPLVTLLTGDVVNSGQYGPGGFPDWDGTDLADAVSLHTDERMAFTWSDDGSDFPPSRIDYHIYSNSVLTFEKGYTLRTETMSTERLAQYGLEQFDTYFASDHLPKVSDFSIAGATPVVETEETGIQIFPNPFSQWLAVEANEGVFDFSLVGMHGGILRQGKIFLSGRIETGDLPPGIFFLEVRKGEQVFRKKVVKF